jgi:hypothetical protein
MWDEQHSSYSNLQRSEDKAQTNARFIDSEVRKLLSGVFVTNSP